MRNAIFAVLSSIVILILANFAIGATSEVASASASVTVNQFVDITLTDAAPGGFSFGGDPGTANNAEASQDGVTPAATVTREATSNVDVNVRLKGTDFTGAAGTIAVINVAYDDDGLVDELPGEPSLAQNDMTTDYPGAAYATLTSGSPSVKIWFWLDISSRQAAGNYASTFSFEGNSV